MIRDGIIHTFTYTVVSDKSQGLVRVIRGYTNNSRMVFEQTVMDFDSVYGDKGALQRRVAKVIAEDTIKILSGTYEE